MIRLILLNILLLLIFVFFGFFSVYFYISKYLETKALENYNHYKNSKYFHTYPLNAGVVKSKENPTSFIRQVVDKDKIRIGIFGDSHVEGSEVKLGHDFPSVLQRLLGEKYQIFNFGSGGENFNQTYIKMNFYIDKYKLDEVVLGPRALQLKRFSTFNSNWRTGGIPNSRFIIKNNKIKEISIPGKNTVEKIKNYYKLFPVKELVNYEASSIFILRLFDLIFGVELENPFFKQSNKSLLRNIQKMMLRNISRKIGRKIIHFSDSKKICRSFLGTKFENYSFYCTGYFLDQFPNYAYISHPSSFGHYLHALNLKELLTGKKSKLPLFLDIKTNIKNSKINLEEGEYLSPELLTVFTKSKALGELKELIGWTEYSRILKSFSEGSDSSKKGKYLLIGVKSKESLLSSSIFLKVKINTTNIKSLKKLKFLKIKEFNNIYFLNLKKVYVTHFFNKIFFKNYDIFFKDLKPLFKINYKKKFLYPKFPTYKMVVNTDISAEVFYENYGLGPHYLTLSSK